MNSLDSTLLEFGINPASVNLSLIGEWQRVPTADKTRKRNGSVQIFPNGAVHVENWATGEKTIWRPSGGSAALSISNRRQIRKESALREKGRIGAQRDAAKLAAKIWECSKPADPDHPYLSKKRLPTLELREAHGINGRQERWLISPLYSKGQMERICNLECINSKGEKRPIKGGLRSGVFGYAGPGIPDEHVVIAEGWATAAALHVSLDIPIIFAAGASNVSSVAAIWRRLRPNGSIVIAADNDDAGQKAGKAAGELAGVTMVTPYEYNDWSDAYLAEGAEEVRSAWQW